MTCPSCGRAWWGTLKPALIDGQRRLLRRCKGCGQVVNDAAAEGRILAGAK